MSASPRGCPQASPGARRMAATHRQADSRRRDWRYPGDAPHCQLSTRVDPGIGRQ